MSLLHWLMHKPCCWKQYQLKLLSSEEKAHIKTADFCFYGLSSVSWTLLLLYYIFTNKISPQLGEGVLAKTMDIYLKKKKANKNKIMCMTKCH